ncbi:Maf family protein [Sansalvadorimonas verongulae]|uniref:Maf family protein n=1 Tax=Sansalvadorimonas verongulae TaxID=2172824 RepID=UPI0012BC5334|nr:Maf family protein [Sansalvadorimonas verongulae]MTI14671.1 septum formation inhibitor Maf [Sansalvadorimonas verongulae]
MKIILASGSPYRKRLLKRLNLTFACISPDIDETPRPGETPSQLAGRLSEEKAQAVARDNPDSLIIASDQVAVLGQTILGKPGTEESAFRQLKESSERTVEFLTSITIIIPSQNKPKTCVVPYKVKFRSLSDSEITRYIQADNPLDCAGSFKWEQLGISLFEEMEGSDPTALEGLPLITLCKLLRQRGINLP